jgi:hypothetical protein
VRFDDGDAADFAGHELARYIVFREADFYNPRLWYYGFSTRASQARRRLHLEGARR